MFFGEPFGGLIPGARGGVLSVLLRTGAPLTGRQVHRLVGGGHSLWSVQEALKVLTRLGIVETQTIGRAGVHTINERHAAVPQLRALADPLAMLRAIVAESLGPSVESVVLFGSIARGESAAGSDIDLAVIAAPGWDGRTELQDAVTTGLGNGCDVLVFTPDRFQQAARSGEPVVGDILRYGLALIGPMPRTAGGAAGCPAPSSAITPGPSPPSPRSTSPPQRTTWSPGAPPRTLAMPSMPGSAPRTRSSPH